MKQFLVVMFLAVAAAGWAQEKKQPEKPGPARTSRLVEIRHLSPAGLQRAVNLVRPFGAQIQEDAGLRMVSITGLEDVVNLTEQALKRLDVPSPVAPERNIEVTVHVVSAFQKEGGSEIPPALEPAIKQLRNVFNYKSFRMLESQLVRVREANQTRNESAQFGGMLPAPAGSGPTFQCSGGASVSVTGEGTSRSFRLDRFNYSCWRGFQNIAATPVVSIKTDIDIKEGQKAVVGKTNLDDTTTVFLIVSARLVE